MTTFLAKAPDALLVQHLTTSGLDSDAAGAVIRTAKMACLSDGATPGSVLLDVMMDVFPGAGLTDAQFDRVDRVCTALWGRS